MANPQSPSSSSRFFRAYFVTGQIVLRYFSISLLQRILGKNRTQERWVKAHVKTAEQIKLNILILKGVFIKVGQMLSVLTHFLPKNITKGLEGLQDSVTPVDYSEIEKRFFEEFKKKPLDVFSEFDKTALASASLGQVHLARLKSGEKVAVKVQYPGSETLVFSDLKILKKICNFLNWIFPQYSIPKTYQEIQEIIIEELDFTQEGKNLEKLQANLESHSHIHCPKIFWEYSSSRVLVTEYIDGVKISNKNDLTQLGILPSDVAKVLVHAYCQQIFIDGIYHADPHPGNFLVRIKESNGGPQTEEAEPSLPVAPNFEIAMIDFGAVGKISEPMRQGIAKLLEGVIRRDNQLISNALKAMGFIAKEQDERVFDQIIEFFYEKLKDIKLDQIKQFKFDQLDNFKNLLEFRKLDISFRELFQSFSIPKEWAVLERTLILLVGLTTHLDPSFDVAGTIVPYAEQFVLGKDRNMADVFIDTLKEVALSYLKLPTEIEKVLKGLQRGELQFITKHSPQDLKIVTRSLNRLTYSFLTVSTLALAFFLESQKYGRAQWVYYLSGGMGFLLFIQFFKK